MNTIIKLFSDFKVVLDEGVFGLSILDLFIFFLILIVALSIRSLFAKLVLNRIKKIVKKTSSNFDDNLLNVLISPLKLLPIIIALIFIILNTNFSPNLIAYIGKINKSLVTIFILWTLHNSIYPFSLLFNKMENIFSKGMVLWIIKTLKYLLIFLGIVATLEVWGIKIGPVIAGLGLFGVAVALGAQDLVKNLISGILIIIENSFSIGDIIKITGHAEGTVEYIGFRSTKIRKFDSTPVSIPNYIFSEVPIINYSKRMHRRISWSIGLEYKSTLDQIKNFTSQVRSYIENNEDFIVNESYSCFVRLEKFNDSSIDIKIYCFTKSNDWSEFLKSKESLGIFIKKTIEDLSLNFAFPSQSLYFESNINDLKSENK